MKVTFDDLDSSMLNKIIYTREKDMVTGELEVHFSNGSRYFYSNVKMLDVEIIFTEMRSVGQAYLNQIKKNYPYTKKI